MLGRSMWDFAVSKLLFYKGNWELGKIPPHCSKETPKEAPNPWILLNIADNYVKDLSMVQLSETLVLVSQYFIMGRDENLQMDCRKQFPYYFCSVSPSEEIFVFFHLCLN